jgi:hypothetical protein
MVKRLRVMEKKLTNSGPLRESVDKHSIYTIKKQQMRWTPRRAHLLLQVRTRVLK